MPSFARSAKQEETCWQLRHHATVLEITNDIVTANYKGAYLLVPQTIRKFLAFYRKLKFTIAFIFSHYNCKSNFNISLIAGLWLLKFSFPRRAPDKNFLRTSLSLLGATFPSDIMSIDSFTQMRVTWEQEHKWWCYLLSSFLHLTASFSAAPKPSRYGRNDSRIYKMLFKLLWKHSVLYTTYRKPTSSLFE